MTSKPDVRGYSLVVIAGPYGAVDKPRPGTPKEHAKDWPHIAYTVALYRDAADGRARVELWRGPFKLGVGHVKPRPIGAFANVPGDNDRKERASYLADDWARKQHGAPRFHDAALWADVAAHLAKVQRVAPKLEDVMSSLLLDGSPYFDAQSFEDWAQDLGFNPDSISDRNVFETCRETGRLLTAALGAEEIARLREQFQDY